MERLLRRSSVASIAAAALICAGVAACSSSSSPGSKSKSSSATTTLTMESSPETTITQAFNPYVSTQAVYGMGADGLIYEPLIEFDLADPTVSYPWLATSYSWADGGKQITFTIRSGVKWNNGTPMTAADVAFTFSLLKANAAINLDGLPISSVATSGNTVTLTFTASEYANLEDIAGTAILPKAIWSTVGNPATYTDANPVGTGPYMLSSFTPQGFTLKKNPYYWQPSKVKITNVYFPAYNGNTAAATALFTGQITWTGNYIQGLQKDFVDPDPAYHHYWEAAGGDESFEPNLTKWPTNQLAVRQAISLAVSRSLLGTEGEAGLENPVLNPTGITMPTFSAWSGPVASMPSVSANANAAAAERVLEAAGFTKGSNGYFQKGGKTVAINIIAPADYTDMSEVDSIAVQELKAAGIDASFTAQAVTTWDTDVADGDFQMTEHWSNGGITPYDMYNGWLNSALASGSAATGDYERLNDPTLDSELATLSGANTIAQQAADLVPLEKYVAANLPVIPLVTAADWFEYNSQNFVGWPSASDPYDSGQPSGQNVSQSTGSDEVVILHLSPRT
jgi:peptide/nickel transport system substrate-binding protein